MKNFLYFAEATVETGDDGSPESLLVPAENFLYANPSTGTVTEFLFKGANGNDDGYYRVALTHTENENKQVISGFINCLNANPHTGGIVICADFETGTAVNKAANVNSAFLGLVTGVAITAVAEGSIAGVSGGTTLSTSYGTGIVSTGAGAPQYARKRIGDMIVTTITMDLQGLGAKNDDGDVIGIASGAPDAYFYKLVKAENGNIFKVEMACIENITSGSNNLTDIDLVASTASNLGYDDDATAAAGYHAVIQQDFGAALGVQASNVAGTVQDGDYLYLAAGATHTGDSTYVTGSFIVTLYGAAEPLAPGLV